jgi:antigen flippase
MPLNVSGTDSYRQILRASSIMGAALTANYLVGLVRVKLTAVLLGPSGVGLLGIYTSVTGMIGTVSGLGISGSAVRDIAQAQGKDDPVAIARALKILRRTCWMTGALGWLFAMALAVPISLWIFGSRERAAAMAILGLTVLLGSVGGGETAVLQGVRRIGDIARANVVATLVNAPLAIGLYAWLGAAGILPVLVVSAAVSLTITARLARRVHVPAVAVDLAQTFEGARRMARLGMAFMFAGVLTAGLDMLTRAVISRELGLDAAGIYQAAWALSGLFANFILSAMGTDFYPRLAGVIHDHGLAVRTVNEQTEIGILLGVPGLLATLAFAPLIVAIFYTGRFMPAADLLPWLLLGVFGRVLSWPLGFVQVALGAGRSFAVTEGAFVALQAVLLLWLVPRFGIVGAGYAFAASYLAYTACMLWVGRVLISFRWSAAVRRLLLLSIMLIAADVALRLVLPGVPGVVAGGIVAFGSAVLSARELSSRLGPEHRLVRALRSVPGGKWVARP